MKSVHSKGGTGIASASRLFEFRNALRATGKLRRTRGAPG